MSSRLAAVSTPPSDLPPTPSTQNVGQQTSPSTVVPHTPHLQSTAPSNTLAMISLVTGILSFLGHVIPLIGGGTMALIAIITGWIARRQIAQSGEQGKDIATIGMILGFVNLAITLLIIIAIFFIVVVLGISILGLAARSR